VLVLRCAHDERMLLVARDLARDPEALLATRAMPFVLALLVSEPDGYAISHLALTTPPAALVVCHTTGEPAFAGAFQLSDGGVHISLAALANPGAFSIDVAVRLQDGVLSMDRATYGPLAVPRRAPVLLDPRRFHANR
jgi:hypothetical protein